MLNLVLSVFGCGKPVVCEGRIERHAAAAGNFNGGSGHVACCAAGQEDDGPCEMCIRDRYDSGRGKSDPLHPAGAG